MKKVMASPGRLRAARTTSQTLLNGPEPVVLLFRHSSLAAKAAERGPFQRQRSLSPSTHY